MGGRRWLLVVVVMAALVAPAAFDRDGFPLSTYPMYARSRGDVVSIVTARAATATGDPVRLSLQTIGASDDPLIVQSLLRDAVRAGQAATDAQCRRIADRVLAENFGGDDGPATVDGSVSVPVDVAVTVEVVTETHNVVDHAAGRRSLLERQVHSTCPVVR